MYLDMYLELRSKQGRALFELLYSYSGSLSESMPGMTRSSTFNFGPVYLEDVEDLQVCMFPLIVCNDKN